MDFIFCVLIPCRDGIQLFVRCYLPLHCGIVLNESYCLCEGREGVASSGHQSFCEGSIYPIYNLLYYETRGIVLAC